VERLNLYETLGVELRDSAVAVRSAYRDLARLSHATIDAAPQFVREMDLAVEVLADSTRRAHYDGVRGDAPTPAGEPHQGGRELHVDLMRDFEGGRPGRDEVRSLFRRSFGPAEERKSGRVMVLDLRIGIVDREPGDVLCLEVPLFHACAVCHGTGSLALLGCSGCAGTGVAEQRSALRAPVMPGERLIPLADMGVRTLVLRVQMSASA
jgi:DnaJ-class molecular chaperone